MRHLALVLQGTLPADFSAATAPTELSIAGVQWHSRRDLWERFHEFEFWSQILIRRFFARDRPGCLTRVLPSSRPDDVQAIAVAGEIASGKTLLCKSLHKKLGFSLVSTRACVSDLTGIPDFGTSNRTQFQEAAQSLIASPSGVDRLAQEIARRAQLAKRQPALIDGLRNTATLQRLRSLLPSLMLVYVEAPRDLAFANYRKRSRRKGATLSEFVQAREHPVEGEITTLRFEADAHLFNAGTRQDVLRAFLRWWSPAPA
jgi:dephospho-CoA kinase